MQFLKDGVQTVVCKGLLLASIPGLLGLLV